VQQRLVHRFATPVSTEARQWTGALPTGAQLPAGVYHFTYISSREGKSIGDTGVEIYAQVAEVRSVDGKHQLITKGGIAVPAEKVTALREAAR
jgi:flagellar basal-body rod modification protein FlgD